MSQKVRIDGVKHTGASVFLGVDHCDNPCWTRNPERVMVWLCDGWRTRFNQRREQRPRSTPVKSAVRDVRLVVTADNKVGLYDADGKALK